MTYKPETDICHSDLEAHNIEDGGLNGKELCTNQSGDCGGWQHVQLDGSLCSKYALMAIMLELHHHCL